MATETPTALVTHHDVPGATLALCSADGVVTRGIGWQDRERTSRLDAAARFPIYSITKTMIATILLQLVDDGAFPLDTPLTAVIPDGTDWLDPRITLRQTLNHTAGLPDYGGQRTYHDSVRAHPETPWDDVAFLACACQLGMQYSPGEGWAYSNIGYLLLRQAIEQTTGTSFAEAIATRIARPLGLHKTHVIGCLAAMRELTPGTSVALSADDVERNVALRYHPGWVAHGLVASTAAETARFLYVLLSGSLVSPESLAAMLTPVRVPIVKHPLFREPSYGLGVMLDPAAEGGMLVGHGGGGPGYSLGVLGLVQEGCVITAAGMANADRGDIGLDLAARELHRMTALS
ncbi:MAG: serine hydrolase domain-containing protein [Thermomicrobiales bacterium]